MKTPIEVSDYETLATRLYDTLAVEPDGLDIHQISEALDVSRQCAALAIRKLRLILGAGDSINVPVRVDGRRHVYFLAGRAEDGHQWQAVRVKTMLSRLEVDRAWWASIVAATSGRTTEGRVARAALRHFTRLAEDIDGISDVAQPGLVAA